MNREHFDALRLRLLSQSNHSAGRIKLIDLQGLKKGISFGLGIILTLGASALLAVAVTGTMNTYVTGAVMDASSLNTNFSSLQTAIESIPNWKSNGTSAYYTDGKVGIGTSSPANTLHISGDEVLADKYSSDINPPIFRLRKGRGTESAPTAVLANDQIAYYISSAYTGTGFSIGSLIFTTATENWSTTNQGTKMGFAVQANGGAGLNTAVLIDQTGHLGLGTTTPAYRLDVTNISAAITMRLTGSGGACTHAPTAGSETVACSSDEKLKKNIRDSKPALDELLKFQIKDYEIKSTGASATGVIAQEVQKTFPELVHKDEKGILLVEQINPWKMLKAIQELKSLYDHEKSLSSDLSLRLRSVTEQLASIERSRNAATDENSRKDALNASLTERLSKLERENSRMTALEARLRAIETMQTAGKR